MITKKRSWRLYVLLRGWNFYEPLLLWWPLILRHTTLVVTSTRTWPSPSSLPKCRVSDASEGLYGGQGPHVLPARPQGTVSTPSQPLVVSLLDYPRFSLLQCLFTKVNDEKSIIWDDTFLLGWTLLNFVETRRIRDLFDLLRKFFKIYLTFRLRPDRPPTPQPPPYS